jgi:hypothetical protein
MKLLLFVIFVFVAPKSLAQFGTEQLMGTDAALPVVVTVADIDGDGYPDVISGARSTNGVSWYKNLDGQGSFGSLQLIVDLSEIYGVSTADLDGDGDIDILVSDTYQDKVLWIENLDGAGTFGPPKIIDNNADNVNDAIGVDLDRDGDLDILAAIDQQNTAAWYENLDGLGSFSARNLISSNLLGCRSVFAADIDNDGDLDVVANSANTVTISWFENLDGQGNFGSQNIVAGQAAYVADVFCADIDGDGDMDIMGCTNGDDRVAWHENLDGQGTFGPQRVVTNEALQCTSVFCADLDNDGDVDVLYGSTESAIVENSEIAWSENLDGLGNFGPKQVIGNELKLTRAVCAADIDGDTDMDVFAASQNNNKLVWYENYMILGVMDNSLRNLRVSPNPSSDKIFIDSKNESIEEIVVYDIFGKRLFSEERDVKELDISHLQNGLYFLQITTHNGSLIKKILKN